MIDFIQKACRAAVVKRATIIALIVGIVIAVINYYDKLMYWNLTGTDVTKIAVTFLVPYIVSTISAVMAINEMED